MKDKIITTLFRSRKTFLTRYLALSLAMTFAAAETPSHSNLQQRVEAIATAHHGGLTLFAEDLATGRTVAIEPDRKVATASVIKLAILFEALEQIRSGKVKFEDQITLRKEDQVRGAGLLLFFDAPAQLTFKNVLTLMIVMSDNTATNLVIDHLGFAAINHRIESIGLHDTYLFNKVFASSPQPIPSAMEPDHKKFGLGKTTAREMASVMARIYHCELGTSDEPSRDADLPLCTAAMTMLGNQFYRDSIPRYLDGWNAPGTGSGTAVGNKSGSLDQIRNDVAIIAAKRGPSSSLHLPSTTRTKAGKWTTKRKSQSPN